MKRVISIMLIAAFLLTTAIGCNNSKKADEKEETTTAMATTQEPEKKEVKTFTLYMGASVVKPMDDLFGTEIGKKITELTGVKLNIEYLVGSDGKTKAGVMIASGDLPDLIEGHEVHQNFVDAGVLVPIENYIEKSKYAKEAYGTILKRLVQADGHTYFLTPYRENPQVGEAGGGFWLPADVLEENGWPVVKTWSQYLSIIRDYAKKHPTINGQKTIGFTFCADDWRTFTLTHPQVWMRGGPNDGWFTTNPQTGEGKVTFADDLAKKYYSDLNDLYSEGLIEKTSFVQKYDQYIAQLSSGRVLGFWDFTWQCRSGKDALVKAGMESKDFVAMPVVFDGVETEAYNGILAPNVRDGISITKNCKDPDAAFAFLDEFLNPEIQTLVGWGIKDETYTVGSDGKFTRTPEIREKLNTLDYVKKIGIRNDAIGFSGFWGFPARAAKLPDGNAIIPMYDPAEIKLSYKPHELKVLDAYKVNTFSEILAPQKLSPYGYGWDVIIPEGSEPKIIEAKLTSLVREYVPKLIMSKNKDTFEAVWKEYTTKFNGLNIQVYEQYYSEQIKKRMENWK